MHRLHALSLVQVDLACRELHEAHGRPPLLVMPRNVGVSDSIGVYCLYELGKAFVFRASQLVFRWPIVAYLISALSVRPRPIPSARASHSWSLYTRLQLTRGRRVWKLAALMPSAIILSS